MTICRVCGVGFNISGAVVQCRASRQIRITGHRNLGRNRDEGWPTSEYSTDNCVADSRCIFASTRPSMHTVLTVVYLDDWRPSGRVEGTRRRPPRLASRELLSTFDLETIYCISHLLLSPPYSKSLHVQLALVLVREKLDQSESNVRPDA